MTTPFGTPSPFSDDASTPTTSAPQSAPQPQLPPEEFTFHTMKEDLLELSKNPQPTTVQAQPAVAKPPVVEKVPANIPVAPLPSEAPTPKPAAEPQKVAAPLPTPTPFAQAQPKTAPVQTTPQGLVEVTRSEEPVATKNGNASKIILSFIILLILALLAAGGYYFWKLQTAQQVPITSNQPLTQEPAIEQPTPVAQTPAIEVPPVEKFSVTNPNFLVLDIATLTSEQINAAILAAANELKQASDQGPYEFIVVDANNNPVAFPIFATAAKFNLSPNVLKNLDEKFSLYFFNDAGNMRLAIAATIKDKNALTAQMPIQEKTFVTDASFLFLGNTPEIKSGTFNSGTYKNFAIRYLNLNQAQNLSIDYTITDQQLVIGTSKNTLRAVLDKMAVSQPQPTSQAVPTNTVSPTATDSESSQVQTDLQN